MLLRDGDAAARVVARRWSASTLPGRVGGRLPPVDVVDLRRDGGYPLSRPLQRRPGGDRATSGGRAVLLLNRRGEAPALHCRALRRDVRAAATATSR